jgi:hypothetical protein
LFLGFAAGASIDFGVVSIFFHLNYAGLVAFGIRIIIIPYLWNRKKITQPLNSRLFRKTRERD